LRGLRPTQAIIDCAVIAQPDLPPHAIFALVHPAPLVPATAVKWR
jgi:hypothetical protein